MTVTSPFFVLLALGVVFLTLRFFPKSILPEGNNRFGPIDGIRGYLAYFVFLHHSIIWYFYLHEGVWRVPPTRLFRHLGQASVAIFFMITSFLFVSKILNSNKRKIDWRRIYVSRVLRLVPLYLFAMIVLVSFVLILTDFTLKRPPEIVVIDLLKWLSFTIFGNPDLNGLEGTNLLISGVTWSLPYEWFFYFLLPVISFLLGNKVSKKILFLSILSIYGFYLFSPAWYHLAAFVGGAIVAFAVKKEFFKSFLLGKSGAIIFIFSLLVILFGFSTTYTKIPLFFLTIAFFVIASGNDVFGLFSNTYSKILGEMTYSIYLLHGLLLFFVFKFVLSFEIVKSFSIFEYWAVIYVLTPILLVLSFITFKYIERSSMQKIDVITDLIFKKKTNE